MDVVKGRKEVDEAARADLGQLTLRARTDRPESRPGVPAQTALSSEHWLSSASARPRWYSVVT